MRIAVIDNLRCRNRPGNHAGRAGVISRRRWRRRHRRPQRRIGIRDEQIILAVADRIHVIHGNVAGNGLRGIF